VTSEVIAGYGLHPTILDGSGLSRGNRSSPREVVALLRAVQPTAVGRLLAASLPLVGVSGTVQGLAVHTAAQGQCSAKTGTLTGVTNLAGYCHTRGHHLLAFAIFLDGPSNWQSFAVLSRALATIAGLGK
jgi:serine-type D-Ala-D-Ala carboxypeptidase/endopeptidase (penicillin-binding protein 4)